MEGCTVDDQEIVLPRSDSFQECIHYGYEDIGAIARETEYRFPSLKDELETGELRPTSRGVRLSPVTKIIAQEKKS